MNIPYKRQTIDDAQIFEREIEVLNLPDPMSAKIKEGPVVAYTANPIHFQAPLRKITDKKIRYVGELAQHIFYYEHSGESILQRGGPPIFTRSEWRKAQRELRYAFARYQVIFNDRQHYDRLMQWSSPQLNNVVYLETRNKKK